MIPDISWSIGGFFQLIGFLFCAGVSLAAIWFGWIFFWTFVAQNITWPRWLNLFNWIASKY